MRFQRTTNPHLNLSMNRMKEKLIYTEATDQFHLPHSPPILQCAQMNLAGAHRLLKRTPNWVYISKNESR